MRTIEYLTDPALAGLYWPGVAAGLSIGVLCALLSPLVVLKRLAFIGQGVSHAAFGGVGLAAAIGVLGAGSLPQFGVVLAFCLGAAVLMGLLGKRGRTESDTAIGIVLVVSMALGAILIRGSNSGVSWESFLFGDILVVDWPEARLAFGVLAAVAVVLWAVRRPLLYWAFDPVAARAVGVSDRAMTLVLMTLLALATVTAMKLVGVVLATALLVLPGAISLRLVARSSPAVWITLGASLMGVASGIVLSFELNWPPGPSIVCALTAMFGAACVIGRRR